MLAVEALLTRNMNFIDNWTRGHLCDSLTKSLVASSLYAERYLSESKYKSHLFGEGGSKIGQHSGCGVVIAQHSYAGLKSGEKRATGVEKTFKSSVC